MNYVGIDYHKAYSVVAAMNERGQLLNEARIAGNSPVVFAQFFDSLNGPATAVLEGTRNWGYVYDLLHEIEPVKEVQLANAYKVRVIAEAQVKTDKIDARALANLLRGDLIPRLHVPTPRNRCRKNVLRQRVFWVRSRTMIRNRVHTLVEGQRGLRVPVLRDLFGKRGTDWLRQLQLPEPDATLLRQDLAVMERLNEQVKELDRLVAAENRDDRTAELLQSLPGVGEFFAAVLASEIDTVARFHWPAKLCAYAGLAPTTSASGGKCHQGRLFSQCNRWMRWALIEASWVAIQCSSYFGELYRLHKLRGKKSNQAIVIVARRLCEIAWHLLKENRPYEERPVALKRIFPGRSEQKLIESDSVAV
jgi:transposase